MSGAMGNAGEFAHMNADPHGPLCSCGRRGCLLQYATPKGILHLMQRAHAEEKNRNASMQDAYPLDVADVLAPDAPGWMAATVDDALSKVGEAVARLTMFIDPERIIFGGPLTDLFGTSLIDETKRALEQQPSMGRASPLVSISTMGGDAGPIGAASLPFHGLYSPWEGALEAGR